jgi:hypothetical protein
VRLLVESYIYWRVWRNIGSYAFGLLACAERVDIFNGTAPLAVAVGAVIWLNTEPAIQLLQTLKAVIVLQVW